MRTGLRASSRQFRRIQRAAARLYEKWDALDTPPDFVHPLWIEARSDFSVLVTGGVPFDFLETPIIRHTLYRTGFGELDEAELAYIESSPPDVRSLCLSYEESPVGSPVADCDALGLSVSSLDKLYYFARLRRQLPTPRLVVDFGGGYGHMCHVLQMLLSPRPTTSCD